MLIDRRLVLSLLIGITALSGSCGRRALAGMDSAAEPKEPKFRIVAYLPDYRLDTFSPTQLRFVTDLIYFSIEPTATGDLNLMRLGPDVVAKLKDFKQRDHIRVYVAVGGWSRSTGFGPMTSNPAALKRFVDQLTQFCRTNDLDGVDYDWEGPENAAETAAYANLLTQTKTSFEKHKLRVTVTLAAWYKLSGDVLKSLDGVQIMAYDHDGRHSTFEQAKTDVKVFQGLGVPNKKIILGIPFYGRGINDRNHEATYSEIVAQYRPTPQTDEVDGIYFNGINTVQQKTQYAIDNSLGGVMVWELGQDTQDQTSLLQTIYQSISKANAKP